MNEDQLIRRVIANAQVARQVWKSGNLQAVVDLIEGCQRDIKEAVWLLERKIAHQERHNCAAHTAAPGVKQ